MCLYRKDSLCMFWVFLWSVLCRTVWNMSGGEYKKKQAQVERGVRLLWIFLPKLPENKAQYLAHSCKDGHNIRGTIHGEPKKLLSLIGSIHWIKMNHKRKRWQWTEPADRFCLRFRWHKKNMSYFRYSVFYFCLKSSPQGPPIVLLHHLNQYLPSLSISLWHIIHSRICSLLSPPFIFTFFPQRHLTLKKQQKFPLHGNSQPQKHYFLCGPFRKPHLFISSLNAIAFNWWYQMRSQILYEFLIRQLVQDRDGHETCNTDILMLLVVHCFSYHFCAGLPFWISFRLRGPLISFALCYTRWGKKTFLRQAPVAALV